MPVAYMIHGFAGVGKTTFSKNLEQKTGAIRFSPDDWMTVLYGNNPPMDKFSAYQDSIMGIIWKVAENALRAKADIILDFGFWRKEERIRIREKLESDGVIVQMYALHCPEDTMISRILKRTEGMPEGAFIYRQKRD